MTFYDERWQLTATNVPGRKVIVNSAMAFLTYGTVSFGCGSSLARASGDGLVGVVVSLCYRILMFNNSASQILSPGAG